MRWLFAFVLLLNIVYIVWQLNMPEVENKPSSLTGNSPAGKNVQSIVLLSELTASDESGATELTSLDASKAAEYPIKANAGAQDIACFTIGSFYQRKKLQLFKRKIEPYVDGMDRQQIFFQEREEEREIIYWVYIKPERNRQAAIAMGQRLKANKIKDYYVIRQGDNNNGVSLGHFKDEKRANNVVNKVKKLGIEVTIDPLHKGKSLFWLDFQVINMRSNPEFIVLESIKAEIAKWVAAGSKIKINVKSRRCES